MLQGPTPPSIEPILVDLDGGRYVIPILPTSLTYMVAGSRTGSSGGGGGKGESGGGATAKKRMSLPQGDTGVRGCYDAHLPALSLRDEDNSRPILARMVLTNLYIHVLCKDWHLCGVCWEDCERKKSHVPTSPEVAATIAWLLKVAWGDWHEQLQHSGGRPSSPQNPQYDIAQTNLGKCNQLSGWMAKRKYKDNSLLLSSTTSVANSVDLEHDPYPASTASLETPSPYTPTLLLEDLASLTSGPAPFSLTSGPASPAPTQPCPVVPTRPLFARPYCPRLLP